MSLHIKRVKFLRWNTSCIDSVEIFAIRKYQREADFRSRAIRIMTGLSDVISSVIPELCYYTYIHRKCKCHGCLARSITDNYVG